MWQKGSDVVQALVRNGRLQEVPPSSAAARRMIVAARRHLASAEAIVETDPPGAYALLYDASRKALAAVLELQGLRATSAGGHVVLLDALMAQFDPPMGHLVKPFDRLRRRRNEVEYAGLDRPDVTAEETRRDLVKATALVDDFAATVIENWDSMMRG